MWKMIGLVIIMVTVFLVAKGAFVFGIKKFGVQYEKDKSRYEFSISVVVYLFVLAAWIAALGGLYQKYSMSFGEIYIAFNILAFSSVVWCYFSWDATHFFVRPKIAEPDEEKKKKIFIYTLICVIALWNGYYQFVEGSGENVSYGELKLLNCSVVGTIAFDRCFNQVISMLRKK